jgi:predicted RNase H-like nuclease
LRGYFGDVVLEALTAKLPGCQRDDVLDAFACAWTADRIVRGQAVTILAAPPRDRFGLPMEMVM